MISEFLKHNETKSWVQRQSQKTKFTSRRQFECDPPFWERGAEGVPGGEDNRAMRFISHSRRLAGTSEKGDPLHDCSCRSPVAVRKAPGILARASGSHLLWTP